MVSTITFGALPKQTRYISDRLIIGGKQGIANLRQLRNEETVSSVIDLRNGRFFKRLKEFLTCKLLGIKYTSKPMVIFDKHPLSADKFEEIHSIIQNNTTGKTYVHCNRGLHRSLLVAAFEEFRAGRIRSFQELSDFLKDRNYFKLNKKVRFGIKVSLSPEDIQDRTNNLEYQKKAFWKMIFS